MNDVITVQNLCSNLHYNLNWSLRKNEIHGIIGASGEGKSCFLKALLDLFPYETGIILNENNLPWNHLDESIGVLFQSNGLLNNLSIGKNISMPLIVKHDMAPKYATIIAKQYMQKVGLDEKVYDYFPLECSGGMQKRAALARALVLEPKILFLDEPTNGLDCQLLEEYDSLLRSLKNVSIIMVTHDLARLSQIANRISILVDRKFYTGNSLTELKNNKNSSVSAFLKSYLRTSACMF